MTIVELEDQSVELTPVQVSIIRMLARGFNDSHIAKHLGLGVRTVQRHVSNIMQVLRVRTRFEAGVAVAKAGLLDDAQPGQRGGLPR